MSEPLTEPYETSLPENHKSSEGSTAGEEEELPGISVDQVLEAIDSLKPNSFTREEKLSWLNSFEGQVDREIFRTHESPKGQTPPGGTVFRPYTVGDGERQLLIPPPFAPEIYLCALENAMDHYNGDTVRYNNSLDRLSGLYNGFSRWYNRNYRPFGRKRKYW